jgi:hypothetical protein
MAAPVIIEDKPPKLIEPKGPTRYQATDPWTAAQRTAGGRWNMPAVVPGVPMSIAGAWTAPPPLPVVAPRQQLANQIVAGSQHSGAYDTNSGGGGNNWGSSGWGGAQNGGWGRTSTGVRSSAHNADGSWGNSVSNSGNGGWSGWGGLFGGGGGSSNGGRGGGWGSASEGGMGGRGSFF